MAKANHNLATAAEVLPDDTLFLKQLAGDLGELQRLMEGLEAVQHRFEPRGKERRQEWHATALTIGDAVRRSLRLAGRKTIGMTSGHLPAIAVVQRALREIGIHQEKSTISTMLYRKTATGTARPKPKKGTT